MPVTLTRGPKSADQALEDEMFGGNLLFHRDVFGTADEHTLDEVVDRLGITHLRYPGGAVTEHTFDVNNPDATSGIDNKGKEVTLMPVSDFVAEANARGLPMTFVLPSNPAFVQSVSVYYVDGKEKVHVTGEAVDYAGLEQVFAYAKDLIDGKYGAIGDAVFELGNEFYDQHVNAHDHVYGEYANALAIMIDDYASQKGVRDQITIAVQGGRRSGDTAIQEHNQAIIDQFEPEGFAAIDAVIQHYYPNKPHALSASSNNQTRADFMDDWEAAAGKPLQFHVSEWNVGSPGGLDGLLQVSMLADFLEFFQRNGVDRANVWPLQQNNENDLAGEPGSSELTLAGEFFQLASHTLTGKTFYDSAVSGTTALKVKHFEDDDGNITLILTNTTAETFQEQISLTDMIGPYGTAVLATLNAHNGGTNAFEDHEAEAHLNLANIDLTDGNGTITLDPYATTFLTIAKTAGLDLQSDLDIGEHSGESGDEILTGSAFGDRIDLGAGDDTVHGAGGNDTLIGGQGNDELHGGAGDDILLMRAGGDPTDHTVLYGGEGADIFRIEAGATNFHIADLNPDEDRVEIVGQLLSEGQQGQDWVAFPVSTPYPGHPYEHLKIHARSVWFTYETPVIEIEGVDYHAGFEIHLLDDDATFFVQRGHRGIHPDSLSPLLDPRIPPAMDYWREVAEPGQLLEGSDQDDYLRGDTTSDILNGGLGSDRLYGGDGNDLILGGVGDDILRGEDGDDLLMGEAGHDWISGGQGDDTVYGGAEDDRLYGGAGADLLSGDAGIDRIYGEDGNDNIYGGDGDDWLYGDGGDDILGSGAGNDRLKGGRGHDLLQGGLGDDRLYGEDDDDLLDGGAGTDWLYGGNGRDTLVGGEGNDRLDGERDDDYLAGGSGDDQLDGDYGNDTLHGGDGADRIEGDYGSDTLDGGDGDDTLDGGYQDDQLAGGRGDDRLEGGYGCDTLEGGDGADLVDGGYDDDVLSGGAGADTLQGDYGNDTLIGGSGADILDGGYGTDTFVFASGDGRDTITGFEAGDDLIDLGAHGLTDPDRQSAAIAEQGINILIDLGPDTILIEDATRAEVEAAILW
ncbi:hypothetical protein [Roseobacter sp. HKCCA0434]|uniref:calcium-binding protein n=1 Tax=Roseobacter sp. HKCCA0434 TaxID=3079297 RepID=UPI002905AF60|nr:hypothetical protein [Roseobacter sp. HKCCA0434]